MSKNVFLNLLPVLSDRFNEDGLRTLCAVLEIRYDHLQGKELKAKARELIVHLRERERLIDL